ncbi:MAG: hypothetical protein QXD42_04000 [Nitrososphaerales archaeon]
MVKRSLKHQRSILFKPLYSSATSNTNIGYCASCINDLVNVVFPDPGLPVRTIGLLSLNISCLDAGGITPSLLGRSIMHYNF